MKSPELVPASVVRRVLLQRQALAPSASTRRAMSRASARSIAGGASATGRPRSSAAAVASLVEQLGYVQIDSINVVERAHHLILSARLDHYRSEHFTATLEDHRTLFEHWTHDACAIPSRWYPHWHHRFARFAAKDRSHGWWRERFGTDPARVMRRVLARVRREGPLRARDFVRATGAAPEPGGWWNWHPDKAALEHLWRSGRLAIAARDRFEKIYDLSERVHPELHAQPAPDASEHIDWLCRTAIDRLGFATEREIAAFWSAATVSDVRIWVRAAVARGALERVLVEPKDAGTPIPCVTLPTWREWSAADDSVREIAILAPFDPVVRDRVRLARLFGFHYRFEAFTPAAKRRYGYYTMPLLEGDRFIGRIDPKFDREHGVLTVRGPWWEPGVTADRARVARFEHALDRLARTVGAVHWRLANDGKRD